MINNGLGICLLNDSFPPVIDGVANVVLNYAEVIDRKFGFPIVATPKYPKRDVSVYPFPVLQYTSLNTVKIAGYRMGNPLASPTAAKIAKYDIDIIHSHCPAVSTFLARIVREKTDAPIVFTYHTKFDIDIARVFSSERLRALSTKLFLNNLEACDEVWAVSNGAINNMRELGYSGEARVMNNGVDIPQGRASDECVEKLRKKHGIPENIPVFLYVGRMMWYKGLRISLDAIAALRASGADFRMLLVGGRGDVDEVLEYIKEINIEDKCIFAGAVYDREVLRAYYSLADLFLFPSTYDTNGIVVREAAACGCASVLVKGSCAAEGTTDGVNAVLIDENSDSLFAALSEIMKDKETMRKLGDNAMRQLYISWEDAVSAAVDRYKCVIDLKKRGMLPRNGARGDEFLKIFNKVDSFMRRIVSKHPHRSVTSSPEFEAIIEKELDENEWKEKE